METAETRHYIPCRSERNSPTNDWSLSWKLCRLRGLGSDLTSFNFKLLHGLLVTKQRLHQLTPASSATCNLCEDQVEEDLQHAFIHCKYNNEAGQTLLTIVQNHIPDITAASLLRLELRNLPEDNELSVTTFISTFLLCLWEKRYTRSRIVPYDIRATLEARCLLLRKTRFGNQLSTLSEMIGSI